MYLEYAYLTQLGEIMGNYAFNKLGIKKCAILYEIGSDYSAGVTKDFTDAFTTTGGEITITEAYKTGDVDFRAQLSKIKNQGDFDAIFIPALYKELGLIANQARSLGINELFIGPDCWMMEDLFTIAADAMEGGYFICAMDVNSDKLTDFNNQYYEKYGSKPGLGGTNAYFAYDAFLILKNAIETANEIDYIKIRDAIEATTDLQGLTSKITMDKSTHNPIREATIFLIDHAKFVVVENYSIK